MSYTVEENDGTIYVVLQKNIIYVYPKDLQTAQDKPAEKKSKTTLKTVKAEPISGSYVSELITESRTKQPANFTHIRFIFTNGEYKEIAREFARASQSMYYKIAVKFEYISKKPGIRLMPMARMEVKDGKLICHECKTEKQITGKELHPIAHGGSVTICCDKCGKGLDVMVR